ncbi:radical SAM protein [Desulfitobacterium sp. THU1]|uniref:radical SAM/SPASM domain-containing protein n=1 Tax=Desulfitobacterium sp. THU1 TaxID=3138072 RepID=UPI0031202C60
MPNYELKEMKVEVTKKCPLACVHCSSDSNENQVTEITIEKCLELIKQAIDLGIKELSISGGEPLVWNGIDSIVKFACDNGLNVNLYTSGNVNNINEVFKNLSIAGLTTAIFSLYSDKREEHNRVTRKKDSFDDTLAAIEAANKNGIATEIHFVALKKSYHKLEDVVRFSSGLGVRRVSVLRFVPQGRGTMLEVLSKEENYKLATTIRRLREEGFEVRTGSPYNVLLLNENPKCMAARDRLIISSDLKIYPCDAFKQISSVTICKSDEHSSVENDTLSICWEKSPYFNTVRESIQASPEGICKTCSLFSKCLTGCLAQKYILNRSLSPNKDPACTRY